MGERNSSRETSPCASPRLTGQITGSIGPSSRVPHGFSPAASECPCGVSGWLLVSPCARVALCPVTLAVPAEPIAQPELKSQILQRERGWCRLALLCSGPGNVSYSWACPGDPPGQDPGPVPGPVPDQIPGIPSRLIRRLPEGAEPQICLCNASGPAGWSAARALLTCPGDLPARPGIRGAGRDPAGWG